MLYLEQYNQLLWIRVLTLRGLSLFFKILPISNTGDSTANILATVHLLYHKLGSFSDMEYYFYQLAYWDSKVPKRFVGLNQMQCSPSFDWNWGNKMQQEKCLRYPPDCIGGVTETPNCMGSCTPFEPPLTGDTPF